MTPIDVSTFMTPGQQYTFDFKENLFGLTADTYQTVLGEIQGISYASSVSLIRNGSFSGSDWFVTFTYVGDGSDTIATPATDFPAAVSKWYYSWNFVSAVAGPADIPGLPAPTGPPGTNVSLSTGAAAGVQGIKAVIPSAGWLTAIAVLAVIGIFVYAGGPQLLKGAFSAAKT